MDTRNQVNDAAVAAPAVEVVRRHELHYACGCTTTRIEAARRPAGELPECAGHHHPLIEQIETTQYKLATTIGEEN